MPDVKLPGIPSITPVKDPTIASILRPVKESLEIIATSLYGVPSSSGSTNTPAYEYYVANSSASSTPSDTFVYDYTPPPAPTGVSVGAAFQNIIIEWDSIPTNYTNHAYTEVWRSSIDSLSGASLVGFAPGLVYVDAVGLSKTYYYWIRFVSTSDVKGAYNSSVGTVGNTGKVGNSDLSDAIITAEKISTGAIDLASAQISGLLPNSNLATLADSNKFAAGVINNTALASGAVSVTKFASGIEPVTIVTGSLPTVKSTETIVYNSKLYRWNGSAYIASVATTDLTGQITTTQITDNAITTGKIAANAITASQIAADTITAAQIAAGAITASELAAGAVTAGKLSANAIIANDGVIANLAVGSSQIQDAAIISAKIGTAAVGSAAIADLAVLNSKIANLAVDSGKIADLAVGTAKIADASIATAKIQDLAVTTAKIQDAAITNAKIGTAAIGTANIGTAAITTAKIADAQITTAKIADAQITTAKIADANITTAKIADANITAAKITDATITAAKIADATITGAKIASATIGSANIVDLTIGTGKIAVNAVTNSASSNSNTVTMDVVGGYPIFVTAYRQGSYTTYSSYSIATTITVSLSGANSGSTARQITNVPSLGGYVLDASGTISFSVTPANSGSTTFTASVSLGAGVSSIFVLQTVR